MNYDRLLHEILNVGEAMTRCGAENKRVEDSMYRMLESYDFKFVDVFAIQNNIQATICTKDDHHITQVRLLKFGSFDYDKLDYLNSLSRYIVANKPEPEEVRRRYLEVMNRKGHERWVIYLASIMGTVGFGVYFGCDFVDALVCAFVCAAIQVWFGKQLEKTEYNMFIYNLIVCFTTTMFVVLLGRMGIGHHPYRIILGLTMLLISGLGTTNGIRDMIQRDIFSGILNITNSFLGGIAIACGTGLALIVFHGQMQEMYIAPNVAVQIISAAIATWGFALCFGAAKMQAFWSGVGGFITCAAYTYTFIYTENDFFSVMVASVFVGGFSFIMSRVHKAPTTIFLTTSIMPVIPGAPLFYMMLGVVQADYHFALEQTILLFQTCLAIALGFIIVDIIVKYYVLLVKKIKNYKVFRY